MLEGLCEKQVKKCERKKYLKVMVPVGVLPWLWSSGYNAGYYGSFGEEMIYAALGGFAVAILNTEI